MSILIQLFNPSCYPRKGNIALPWKDVYELLKLNAGEFIIEDDAGNTLPYQVDIIDPEDHRLDLLIIGLVKNIPPGADDYSYASSILSIKKGCFIQEKVGQDDLQVKLIKDNKDNHKELIISNEKIKFFFNLTPYLNNEREQWYSGCATSVLLNSIEALDVGYWIEHDKEKRCMQVDQVIIPSPPWDTNRDYAVDVYNKPYNVISINNNGSNRVSVTISTESFEYILTDYNGRKESKCISLYRVLSLNRYSDFMSEILFLNVKEKIPIRFKVKYFSYINMGHDTKTYFFTQVPDWLAIGNNNFDPCNGYGFATDVHNESFISPHPGFPCAMNASKSYSWSTGDGVKINCIHQFYRGRLTKFDDCSGRHWYEEIYKPLKAKIATK